MSQSNIFRHEAAVGEAISVLMTKILGARTEYVTPRTPYLQGKYKEHRKRVKTAQDSEEEKQIAEEETMYGAGGF